MLADSLPRGLFCLVGVESVKMNKVTLLSYPAIDFDKGLVAVSPHSSYSRARPRASFNPMKRRLTQARRNALLQYSTSPVISTMTTTPMLAVCPVYVWVLSSKEHSSLRDNSAVVLPQHKPPAIWRDDDPTP